MMKALDNNYQYSFFFAFSFKFVKPIRHFYISRNALYSSPPPLPKKQIVEALPSVHFFGQLFKRSSASVIYNRVLSHFQFAERFYVNAIYREQFHDSTFRRQEKHLSSLNHSLRKGSGGPKNS